MITIGELTGLGRMPCRKVRHPSEGAALAHIRSLQRAGKVKDEARIHCYPCRPCGGWHVGHTRADNNDRQEI